MKALEVSPALKYISHRVDVHDDTGSRMCHVHINSRRYNMRVPRTHANDVTGTFEPQCNELPISDRRGYTDMYVTLFPTHSLCFSINYKLRISY